MLHLRTLGVVDARDGDGRVLEELLVQPKRTALLVYLAVATPRGFHRRDVLLPLFWPDLDGERARAALRRSLHFLRGTAGADIVLTRGDELAINPAAVDSDVAALDAAAESGAPERVLALYGGDFLAGLFVRGAPAFEEWQSRERDRVRDVAAAARWTLADRAVTGGDLRTATEHAAHATALLPFDEAALRRRLMLLRTVGDHAAALHAYDEFAARVRAEFDAAPARETRQIADALRSETPPRSAAAIAPVAVPTVALAPPPAEPVVKDAPATAATDAPPVPSVDAPVDTPLALPVAAPRRTSRRRRLGVAMVVGALVGIGALVTRQRLIAARTVADGVRVAILPFQVLGDARSAYLGEGMVDLLGASFDGAGPMRPVDRYALHNAGAGRDSAPGDPAEGQAIARRLDADRFVLGTLVEAGGQLRLRATLYDAGGAVHASATAAGPESSLLAMVDDITRQLLAGEYPGGGARLTRTAIRTTTSLPALKAYLHGTQRLRDGRFGEAADSFRVAVAADTTFALAYYSLSMALGWQSAGRDRQSTIYAQEAVRLARALGPHDAALLRAHLESWAGSPDAAEQTYRQILATYPDDVEAWHELGELLFHSAAQRGQPLTDARAAFDHVLAVSALRGSALLHLARIAALQNDGPRLDSLAELSRASAERDARAIEIATLAAFTGAAATPASRDSASASLAARDSDLLWTLGWSVAMYGADWAGSERLLMLLTAPTRPAGDRALGWLAIAQVRAAAGRPAASRAATARAAPILPVLAEAAAASLVALPFLRATPAERAAARAAVTRWNGALPPVASAIALYPLPGSDYRVRLLDALSAGDLESAADSEPPVASWRDLPRATRGPLFPLPGLDRLAQGDRLRRAGRLDEAARWYESFPDADVHDVVLFAPAALGRARVAESAGDRAGAARAYRRAATLWQDAEPPLKAVADSAARRASTLTAPR